MVCLQEHFGSKYMKPDCAIALKQINYFVTRNFKLDPQLYRSCKEDAVHLCHAKRGWADTSVVEKMDPDREPLILSCLYRIAYSTDEKLRLQANCLQVNICGHLVGLARFAHF